jgi:hypothetical protein
MQFRVPDWLSYEIRHKIERLREGYERLHVKDAINDHPRTVAIIAVLSVLLLGLVLSLVRRETSGPPRYKESKKAWFYDLNTGELFSASSKQTGPIKAPSGPLPNGKPAGVRAHVYSYLSDPNAAELFVGFLEKPDPKANVKKLSSDRRNFKEWARGRLIRRVGGDEWISPTSQRGRQIIQELTHPNSQGQTPVYQSPR